MSDAFEKFISPENAWMHEALGIIEEVFGVQSVDLATDDADHLIVTVRCD